MFPYTRSPATLFGYDAGHGFDDQKIQRGGQTLTLPGQVTSPKPHGEDVDVDDDTAPNTVTVPPMGGFVLAHARQLAGKYSAAELNDRTRNYGNVATDVMGYHLPADVWMYSFLAENYLVCDRWYAAHPETPGRTASSRSPATSRPRRRTIRTRASRRPARPTRRTTRRCT